MMQIPHFLLETPKVGLAFFDSNFLNPRAIKATLAETGLKPKIERGRKVPEFAPRIPALIHTVSAFFSPSSSLQLTGKPFDNMSNTGE